MGKIITLASWLAESILMDWDKEDVIKLAKEVAIACHDETDFICLVRRMRDAQNRMDNLACGENIDFVDMLLIEQREAEREVDEYLEKMK